MQQNIILNEGYSNKKYISSGKGPFIFISNKRFIDLANCAGSQILGHNNKIIKNIYSKLISKNISNFASPNIHAVNFSKTLKILFPSFSKFIFCNSGSEAIMKGLRICRSISKNEIIINASGSWHGSVNETLFKPNKKLQVSNLSDGLPRYSKKNIKFVPYGNIKDTKKVLDKYKKKIACILIEPIQGSLPTVEHLNYIKFLEKYSKKNKILFFLDEIITGLRTEGFSFQKNHKINSNISVFGKSFGGGFPLGIIAIDKKISKKIDTNKKKIFFGGTFSGNSVNMFISNEITKYLMKNKSIFKNLIKKTSFFKKEINNFAEKNDLDVRVISYMSIARIIFSKKKVLDRVQRDFFEIKKKRYIKNFFKFLEKKKIFYPNNGIIFFSNSLNNKDLNYAINTIKLGLKTYLR